MVAAHAKILRICRSAGLPPIDADDVAQDIWLWLLQKGRSSEIQSLPWVGGVAVNFVRRYWRARWRRDARESQAASTSSTRNKGLAIDLDTRLSLDEMEQSLPSLEGQLLRLVRNGVSLAEAARSLCLPRGSQDYYRKLLYQHLSIGLSQDTTGYGGSRDTNK